MAITPLLELQNISKSFSLDSGNELKVLNDINLSVLPQETVALLGPSGSGKSTCLKIIAGLMKPDQGKVLRRGVELTSVNHEIAMVFQSFALLPWCTVYDNIALGVEALGFSHEEVQNRMKRVIDLVGLEGFEEAYPRELSGGMKQRVGLARALIMERPVLCLDEPFSSLDLLTAETLRSEVINLWMSQNTATQAMVVVTHNITEAVFMANRILVMSTNPGQIRVEVKNELPYPRDDSSPGFQRMVSIIHDVVTQAIIPDDPVWVPQVGGRASSEVVETIPDVQVGEMMGLLELLEDKGGRTDIYQLSNLAGKDFAKTLFIAKAAELLDLVDTPRNEIVLTELGRRFIRADMNVRKRTLHELFKTLKLVQIIEGKLRETEDNKISSDTIIEFLAGLLPNENPQTVFNTLVSWGRYAEYFGYSDDDKVLYLDV